MSTRLILLCCAVFGHDWQGWSASRQLMWRRCYRCRLWQNADDVL